MMDGFSCTRCDGASIEFPSDPKDDAHVVCRSCGALIGTLGQFRRNIERQYRPNASQVHSGC